MSTSTDLGSGKDDSCGHIFCQACFRLANIDDVDKPLCPFCRIACYTHTLSLDEAVLLGEGAYLESDAKRQLASSVDKEQIHATYKLAIDKFEQASILNALNFNTWVSLYLLYINATDTLPLGPKSSTDFKHLNPLSSADLSILTPARNRSKDEIYYNSKIHDSGIVILNLGLDTTGGFDEIISAYVKKWCINAAVYLATIYERNANYPTSLKYWKLAYGGGVKYCYPDAARDMLRSLKEVKVLFDNVSKPRFSIGEEVECLFEAAGEWLACRITEHHYHEPEYALSYNAPYRVQLLEESDSGVEAPPYMAVKLDIDRYIRKVRVRSIEETRCQGMLDAKVAELTKVYCAKEFMRDIYLILRQDREFCMMLHHKWGIELSEHMLYIYRMLVMYRQPLVRTDSGYHVPTKEEVIAGIRTYFENSAPRTFDETSDANELLRRSDRTMLGVGGFWPMGGSYYTKFRRVLSVEAFLSRCTCVYQNLYDPLDDGNMTVLTSALYESGFSVPPPAACQDPELYGAISRVTTLRELYDLALTTSNRVGRQLVHLWKGLYEVLEIFDEVCECPFVYFFVKYSLDNGMGVPRLALAVYDRMNMQLSREFIRCANPTCEHNRLDQSTGKVKFKQCSRCKPAIYCSRECQVAHYPMHTASCCKKSSDRSL